MKYPKVMATMSITAIVTATGLYAWSQGPAVSKSVPPTPEVKGATTETYTLLQNNYLTTEIPSRFTLKTESTATESVAVQQLYTVSSVSKGVQLFGDQLALTVGRAENGALSSVSSYTLRERETVYTDVSTLFSNAFEVFEKEVGGTYEISAFTARGNRYSAVVLTTQLTNKSIAQEELKHIIDTFAWRQ